jgi:hypothetical protein
MSLRDFQGASDGPGNSWGTGHPLTPRFPPTITLRRVLSTDRQFCAATKRSPQRADEMDVLGLRSEQLGMNCLRQAASLSEIEANR